MYAINRAPVKQLTKKPLIPNGVQATVESDEVERSADIISIALVADPKTGKIPVIMQLENPNQRLRCGIQVNVTFRAKEVQR
jgi:hypothetical protein